jgi:hypothetical protein
MMIPTAMSATFPRSANSLNSFSMTPSWLGPTDRQTPLA